MITNRNSRAAWISGGVALGLVAAHPAAAAPSLGINLGDQGTPATHLNADQSAGVVPQVNWNNYGNTSGSGTLGALVDSAGAATKVTGSQTSVAYYTDVNGDGNPTVNTANGDEILNNGGQYTGPAITISNIPYAKYTVYVYTLLDHSSTFSVTMTPSGGTARTVFGTTPAPGATNYEDGAAKGYTYIAAAGTTQATANTGADYAVFTGLTGSSFTVAVANLGAYNAALDGIQIVADK